jgi:enoyl-CoA hydratase/carnithine racemase
MTEHITTRREGRTLIVTINRPESRNALHTAACAEMAAAFDAFEADDSLWCAIVTGAGDRAFCAGNDLKATASGQKLVLPESGFGGLTHRFDGKKPVIAAVNGLAMGGGFEIVLACDIVVASEAAVFSLPEALVGLAPLGGGMHRLPRKIGMARAMPLLLSARRVSATEGLALGFVQEVAAPDAVLEAALRWATDMERCSPASLRAIKSVVNATLDAPSLEHAMRHERENPEVIALMTGPDAKEGPRAFAEKRAPVWAAARQETPA